MMLTPSTPHALRQTSKTMGTAVKAAKVDAAVVQILFLQRPTAAAQLERLERVV
jgi:hypothetical protein